MKAGMKVQNIIQSTTIMSESPIVISACNIKPSLSMVNAFSSVVPSNTFSIKPIRFFALSVMMNGLTVLLLLSATGYPPSQMIYTLLLFDFTHCKIIIFIIREIEYPSIGSLHDITASDAFIIEISIQLIKFFHPEHQ